MIPSAFVLMEKLPLTASGKLDRRALPAPEADDLGTSSSYVPPRTPLEEQLAEIWSQVLNVDRVGVHDNFFELGGHSLLSVRIGNRIAKTLEVNLPLRTLFEQPTIAQQAERIQVLRKGSQAPRSPLLPAALPQSKCQLSSAQERLWFLEQLEGSLAAYNIPLAWRLRGTLDTQALRSALEQLIARHKPLRTVFSMEGATTVQIIKDHYPFELPCEDLSDLDTDAQTKAIRDWQSIESTTPFDLTRDLMLRARLLRLGVEEHIFLLTMHHIASDGWSVGIIETELSKAYEAGTTKASTEFPPLPVDYSDYALWQREQLQGEALSQLLGFWREELKDLTPLELPSDRPRPMASSYRGDSVSLEIRPELVRRLRELCQSEQATMHMLLLAAFQVQLHRYTGQVDFGVGVPFSGRDESQVDGLVGFFVNTLVLRADLSGNPSFRELISRVRNRSLAAYDHQSLPLQVLLAELQPDRHLSRQPLFQVTFQLLSMPKEPMRLSGLEVSSEEIPTERFKFDLELHLETDGDRIVGSFVYSSDLFDRATIERMVGHYGMLLESIAQEPAQIGRAHV